MSTEVDDFIAHVGVKGMHWGVRKAEDEGAPRERRHLTDDQKRKIKIAAGVVGTAAVIGGIVATAYILNKNGKLPAFSLPKPKVKVPANTDNVKTVSLKTFTPKKVDLKTLSPKEDKKPTKVDVAFQFVNMLRDGMKKPAPKLDPEVQKFMDDSAKRQAADAAEFKSRARKNLDDIESDQFLLQYMKGKNPEALARLMEEAR